MVSLKEKSELKNYYENQKAIIMNSLKGNEGFEVDTSGDAVDEIQGVFLMEMQKALSNRDVLRLRNIQSSLDKIKENDRNFGLCEECEEEIGFARMKALPGVCLCVECAQKQEKERAIERLN